MPRNKYDPTADLYVTGDRDIEESLSSKIARSAIPEDSDEARYRADFPNFAKTPFSLSGGSMPAPPPESGMPTPKGAFARLGLNKKTDYGDFGIGGTGVHLETPQGEKITKYAGTDVNYKKGNLRASINKGAGGHSKPSLTVGIGGTFKKGGKVSSASKRADGCAVKGKTKGRMV
jgi:hypothetical protein